MNKKLKKFYIFIALCALIIYGNPCFCENNCQTIQCKNLREVFQCDKNAEDVIRQAKKEFDDFNYGKAMHLYKKSLKLKPSHPDEVYLHIGISYIALGKYKKAIKTLNKSIEINPVSSSPYYNRGFAYFRLKKFAMAKQDLKKAIEINKPVYSNEIKEARKTLEHIEFLESCE